MRVRCSHGYFFFDEVDAGDLSRFSSIYEVEFAPVGTYFTFTHLKNAPQVSLAGLKYIDPTAIATTTFSGLPWDTMRKNKLVYDYGQDRLVPIMSVTQRLMINQGLNYFFSDGLILPGSVNARGQRVTDYTGYFPPDGLKFRYTEVLFDQYS